MSWHQFYEDFFARFGQERSEIRTGTASPICGEEAPLLLAGAVAGLVQC